PGQHARDAVAVTDVDGRGAGHTFDGLLDGADTPRAYLVEVDVEARLVELDHARARRGEGFRLQVEQAGEAHGQAFLVGAVEFVEGGVDHGHRTGQAHLHGTARVRPGEGERVGHDGAQPGHLAHDPRYRLLGHVASAAGALAAEALRVRSREPVEESPDVVSASL